MTDALAQPLTLPCGAILPNRFAKSAMTEGLADANDRATERHQTLYRRWSEGGVGLSITGNVQVDRRYLERPGNVGGSIPTRKRKGKAHADARRTSWSTRASSGKRRPSFR